MSRDNAIKMKNTMKRYITALLLAALTLGGCQSMEDTYGDWAGDGKIRYIGKCESFEVTAGWKRFVFEWKASPDPMIETIRIVWRTDNATGTYDIPATQNTFATEATFNESAPYTVECYGMDKDGNLSLPLTQYARPFNETHEAVTGFPKMVSKYFFVGGDAILFLDPYMATMRSTKITYRSGGAPQTLEVTKAMFDAVYLRLENVDAGTDIVIDRVAEVEGCLDPVTFESYKLDRNYISLTFDFMQQLKDRYNLTEITPEWIRAQQTLEIDYSIGSLEDVMYFPALRRITLGGNRFMVGGTTLSTLRETGRTVYALDMMHAIAGTEVNIYNNHFNLISRLPWATAMAGNPVLPSLGYLDATGWTVAWTTDDDVEDNYPAYPERILDNDPATIFAPGDVQNKVRNHELVIDMQGNRTLNGFKVTQAATGNLNYLPAMIRIEVSKDSYTWEEPFYSVQSTIGNNFGESTLLRMPASKEARYVKITLVDRVYSSRGNTCLGDFMVF